ncbi:MAG: DUF1501 domain-containing protein [Phycisphaeraceae bacterium]
MLSRREMLRVGGALGLSTLGLQQAMAAQPAASPLKRGGSFGRAKACIVLFLAGGPPQHETWDPKPDASADIRGDFGTIKSTIPGLRVGELMPKLAKQAHKWSVLRAVRTEDNAHSASGYYMLTGRPHSPKGQENATSKEPNLWPSFGAVAGRLMPRRGPLPGAVTVPEHIWNTGMIPWPGQDAGWMGRASDPWLIQCDPNEPNFTMSGLELPPGVDQLRLKQRLSLHKQLNDHVDSYARLRDFEGHDAWTNTAVDLLASNNTRKAFNLDDETKETRDRYGRHRFGQSVLLARRLVESGVSLVQVNWTRDKDGTNDSPMWDTHQKHSHWIKNRLMPPMDAAASALIDDLSERGLLDETLVVWMGEFGRTPKINGQGGRDHWGNVFSMAMAGGGIREGVVHGASDAIGAEPKEGVVKPENVLATVFHCLGLGADATITDPTGRPHHITYGDPVKAII